MYYYSNSEMKGKGKTEIKIDTRGGEVKKLIVHDEFYPDKVIL